MPGDASKCLRTVGLHVFRKGLGIVSHRIHFRSKPATVEGAHPFSPNLTTPQGLHVCTPVHPPKYHFPNPGTLQTPSYRSMVSCSTEGSCNTTHAEMLPSNLWVFAVCYWPQIHTCTH